MGNRLNYDLSARDRLISSFNVKVALNGVWSQNDSTDGTIDAPSWLVAYQNVNDIQQVTDHWFFLRVTTQI